MNWSEGLVVVTGGASFIGSHLVEALVRLGATVRVVDNLSSGRLGNITRALATGQVSFLDADLTTAGGADQAMRDARVVFHLAANHGGRGYIERHQSECASNLMLDAMVFRACRLAGVEKIVFASSGCVYPETLQRDVDAAVYLTEAMVGPPYEADGMYGWAKLMGELTLRTLYAEYGTRSACCRYFTVYGERGHENHAVIAMIARAFIGQTPFVVWGDGRQIRNWTHVSDVVAGTLLAAERIDDGRAVNIGTMERISVLDAAQAVLRYTGHAAAIELRPDMPTGPMNRVADNSLARDLLGWTPRVRFLDGLHQTIDWYFETQRPAEVAASLEHRLLERQAQG